ncbi:hypothetical protein [Nocardiopsis baichengensis]|uniref:hypothetical protein n=1 Tax=Nocardiopsis baichengensis TaxID=280240 RepID=UPI00036B87BF|nr:hypothetical protein [Nocardiopsis baichengensis]
MNDIPKNPPTAPDPGPGLGGDGPPKVPADIASAARSWNARHPGWVATFLPSAPVEWQWVADRIRRLDPFERARGHRATVYAPDLDALSDVVACEVERQSPYLAGKARPVGGQPWGPGAAGPVGGEVA